VNQNATPKTQAAGAARNYLSRTGALKGDTPRIATITTAHGDTLRSVRVLVIEKGFDTPDAIRDISMQVCAVLGKKPHAKTGGVPVRGCGFSARQDVAEALAAAILPPGHHIQADEL
jgi:hypothetical protein